MNCDLHWDHRFESKLWLGHSRTFRDFFGSHASIVWASVLWNRSSNVAVNSAPFIVPSIPTSLEVPTAEKCTHPHAALTIPLCSVSAFHQMKKSYITFWLIWIDKDGESFSSYSGRPVSGIWQTPGGLSYLFYCVCLTFFITVHYKDLNDSAADGCPFRRFSYLCVWVTIEFLVTSLTKAFLVVNLARWSALPCNDSRNSWKYPSLTLYSTSKESWSSGETSLDLHAFIFGLKFSMSSGSCYGYVNHAQWIKINSAQMNSI